jgi:hypothetical protein
MAKTNVKGTQVLDGSVGRADLNTTVSGSAVITRLITNNGIAITNNTGADSGTGDVTVAADLTFLDTKYPSITVSRTQNFVLAAPASGNGTPNFRALVAGDIPAIMVSGVTGLQTTLDNKWAVGGNSLSNTGLIGSTTDQNIQLLRNSIAGLTLKVDGITDVKKLAVGRISGQSGTSWDSLAVFGGNVTIGGRDSVVQGSYDINFVAHTINDNPGNPTRKARIKFGYYDAANFVDKFKRTIEYWRAGDMLVVGSHSTLIADTTTTAPIEGNSVYFGADGSIGIGSSALEASSLKISKIITGGTQSSAYGILNNGVIQSDISVTAYYNNTFASTAASATAYTIPGLIHYSARQLAFGSNSSVSNQYAFYADSTLADASNNYGFYGAIAASTGDWNAYMAGTANNYFSGNVWIGTNTGAYKLDVMGTGHFSQDVTFDSNALLSTTPTAGNHLVNKNYADTKLSGTGTSNYIAKYIGSGPLGNSTIYESSGSVGIGTTSPSTRLSLGTFWNSGTETVGINLSEGSVSGGLPAYGIGFGPASIEGYVTYRSGTSNSAVFGHKFIINNAEVMRVRGDGNVGIGIINPTYKLDVAGNARLTSNLFIQGTMANGSAIAYFDNNNTTTDQSFGLLIDAGTSANDYILKLRNASATEMLVVSGTGSLGIGTTALVGASLRISKNMFGNAGTAFGFLNDGQIQSNATSYVSFFQSNPSTQATNFTLSNLYHFIANQGTFGVGSEVNNQFGFYANNNLIGAGGNYGFFGNLGTGPGRWNFYAAGTASNHFAGQTLIGTTTATAKLTVADSVAPIISLNRTGVGYGVIGISGGTNGSAGDMYFDMGQASGGYFFRSRNASNAIVNSIGVDRNGNVGIGTFAPEAKLDVVGDVVLSGTTGTNNLFMRNGNIGSFIQIDFPEVTNNTANLRLFRLTNTTGNRIFTIFKGDGSANAQHQLNADGNSYLNALNGNVGIGTVSPLSRLHVYSGGLSGATPIIDLEANGTGGRPYLRFKAEGTNYGYFGYGGAGNAMGLMNYQNNSLSIGTNNAFYMTMLADGKIGFGNSITPSTDVHISGTGLRQLRLQSTDSAALITVFGSTYGQLLSQNDLYISAGGASGRVIFQTNTTVRGLISATGDMILSSSVVTPASRLDVDGTLTLRNGSNTTNSITGGVSVNGTARSMQITYNSNTNTEGILFKNVNPTPNLNLMFLRGDGNVGINTITPAYKLDVNGTARFTDDVNFEGNIALNGNEGLDHQFIKCNGSSNEWAYLNTGELQDKDNLVMLNTISGERGFQLFSDTAKNYAESFIFTNPDAGIALALHGYVVGSSDVITEYGMQLDTDGYLYHKKADGTRSRIATTDMISGNITWNGGAITNEVNISSSINLFWNKISDTDYDAKLLGYRSLVTGQRGFVMDSTGSLGLIAHNNILSFSSGKFPGGSIGDHTGVVIDGVMLDLQGALGLVGSNAKFQVSYAYTGNDYQGPFVKLTLVAA